MTVLIRAATWADAALLAQLHGQCFADAWDENAFHRFLQQPGLISLLARRAAETESQAFIVMQIAADEAEILSFGTIPHARRHGLARAILKEALLRAARLHARAMFLEVAEDNAAALALYRSAGFADIGRRQAYYARVGSAVDALMLRVNLTL